MPYVDFKAIREDVSITRAAEILKLKLHPEKGKLRGQCPACQGDDRALVITPERGLFHCFTASEGGSCLDLVMHVTGVDLREAADFLVPHTRVDHSSPQPKAEEKKVRRDEPKKEVPFDPTSFAEKLGYSDDVKSLGISEDEAKALAVGQHRGKVYAAMRYESGAVAGFLCVQDGKLKLPKNLLPDATPNVVKFPKRA